MIFSTRLHPTWHSRAGAAARLAFATTALLTLTGCDPNDGKDGDSSLIEQTRLAVLSDECAFGGVQIDTGVDRNGDGVLGVGEIQSSEAVCNGSDSPDVDTALAQVVADNNLTADPSIGRMLPTIDDPLARLGMLLFFTKGLSGDSDTACVTCHHPFLGGGDDMTLPIGVAAENQDLLGPDRRHLSGAEGFDGGPTVPRNAPTTFNIALWDQVLFHDGRIESATKIAGTNGADGQTRTPDVPFGAIDPANLPNMTVAQARFPVTSPEEMRGFVFEAGNSNDDVRNHLAARFADTLSPAELSVNNWLDAFREGFNDPTGTAAQLITYDNIALAIAAYESSQTFVDNGFKRFVEGDTSSLSGDAKLGALLFYGEAGCAGCHSGDFMSDEGFHVIAMPQVGRGKGNDNGVNNDDDFGRFRETGLSEDRYAFRTPSLLNVAETKPFGHAGAYATLEAVIRHHVNPREAVENFDFSQLDFGVQADNMAVNTAFALDQLDALRASGQSALPEVTLSDADISRLVAFMESLTDYCLEDSACIGRWIPSANDADPDGLRLRALDRFGNPLALQ
ncbi:MAG: hypothetical protein NXH85_04560 [Pseudomonadaceae bacterium]|nr:hypothetical protein [Pseudomonadaceae bacterium]